jgi:hypothetical protein
MQRTGRVGANNSKTSELLGDRKDHDGKGTFLFLRQSICSLGRTEVPTKLIPLKTWIYFGLS